jgi:hypothetical protein
VATTTGAIMLLPAMLLFLSLRAARIRAAESVS